MIKIKQLTWQVVSSDSLRLCQFMMAYEVRTEDYLVALDNEDNIIAAGQLFHCQEGKGGCDAQIELVVKPQFRQLGIGRELVKRLISQANEIKLQRLVGHGDPLFWLSLGFKQIAKNDFVLLLASAVRALEHTWHQGIPMTEFMGLTIAEVTEQSVETHCQMSSCINVHHTMFAGAIYSQAVLTGWGLIHFALQRLGLSGSIVLAEGNVRYRKPVSDNPRGVVQQMIEQSTLLPVLENKKVSIELTVEIYGEKQHKAAATFVGRYVILPQ